MKFMKRPFSVFDGLFLLGLYFKLTGAGFTLTWLEVFIPYLGEAVFVLAGAIFSLFGITDRIKLWFWKVVLKYKTERLAARVKKAVEEAHKPGANPGKYDPNKISK